METDIILEGFLEAEKMHGVRYTRFVGDGDSSVYPTLLQNVPGWGYAIKKIECVNHACKCYRSSLEKLVQEHPSYKGSGGLTLKMRKRSVSAARCAIRMRSMEHDKKKALAALRRDLECFGFHEHCSSDFCKTIRERQSNIQRQQSEQPSDPDQHPHTLSATFEVSTPKSASDSFTSQNTSSTATEFSTSSLPNQSTSPVILPSISVPFSGPQTAGEYFLGKLKKL